MTGVERTAAALELLAEVFESGLTRSQGARLHELGVLDSVPDKGAEDVAVEYERVFGRLVQPFAGVFLDPAGKVGGGSEWLMATALAQAGLAARPLVGPLEHVSGELRILGLLLRKGEDDVAASIAHEHILAWLPALAMAVRRAGQRAYADALDVAVELVAMLPEPHTGANRALPPARPASGRAAAGVTELAKWMVTHVQTGVHVSSDTIGEWGRAIQVPRGFGDRTLILSNLIKGAAHFDRLGPLMAAVESEAELWRSGWTRRAAEQSALEPWARLWCARIDDFDSQLSEMSSGLE